MSTTTARPPRRSCIRSGFLIAVVATGLFVGCGSHEASGCSVVSQAPRTPDPAPQVELTAEDRALWTPGPPDRSRVPVLLYHGIAPACAFSDQTDAAYGLDPEEFAKQMTFLHTAGYQTITLEKFRRFVAGDEMSLPPHPLLLTFDDARADSWTGGDAILEQLGFNAVMFVDVGRVEAGDPEYLTWDELETMEASDRWELQLHSGEGHRQIRYGPAPDDVGAYYAYENRARRSTNGAPASTSTSPERRRRSPPRSRAINLWPSLPRTAHYGQDGTNDPRIPEALLPWLVDRFGLVFTQDRTIFATPGQEPPFGRLQVTRSMTGGELHAYLVGEQVNG